MRAAGCSARTAGEHPHLGQQADQRRCAAQQHGRHGRKIPTALRYVFRWVMLMEFRGASGRQQHRQEGSSTRQEGRQDTLQTQPPPNHHHTHHHTTHPHTWVQASGGGLGGLSLDLRQVRYLLPPPPLSPPPTRTHIPLTNRVPPPLPHTQTGAHSGTHTHEHT